MMRRGLIVVAFAGLLGLLACSGGDDDESGSWGCDKVTDSNACIEYSGSQWTGSMRADYEQECVDDGGIVATSCPTANVVGKCLAFVGTAVENTQIYYVGANVMTAEQVCTATGGMWSP